MTNILKVCGALTVVFGLFLVFTLPPTTEYVGDSLRRSIAYHYAPKETLEKESQQFRDLQNKYDEAISGLVSARRIDTLIISIQIIVIGSLLFTWDDPAQKIRIKMRPNDALEGRRLLVTISAISALRAGTDRANQPSPSA